MDNNQLFTLAVAGLACVILIFVFLRRRANGGKGNHYNTKNGKEFFWKYTPGSRSSAPKAFITVAAPSRMRFSLNEEDALDRLAKWFGFAAEFQTHDAHFDKTIYIQGDDAAFCNTLRGDTAL